MLIVAFLAFLGLYGWYNAQHLMTLHYCKQQQGTGLHNLLQKIVMLQYNNQLL